MDSSALKEAAKFAARLFVFALPLLVNYLTDAGLTEWAGVASAVLALADKYIHESAYTEKKGIVPF